MAGKAKISASIVLDGEKEFNASVTSCNKKLTTLRSELKLNKEAYAENANSIEALRSRQEILTRILGEYKNKQEAVERGQQNAIANKNKLKASIEALAKEQEQETRKLEQMEKASDTSSKELEEQKKVVEELSQKLQKGNENLQRADDRIQKWSNKLNTAQADVLKANRALEQNKKYMKEAESATNGCATSIDKYGNKVKEIKVEVREIGRESDAAFSALANQIVASGAVEKVKEVADALYECSEAAGEFETASAKVSTIADTSKVSMEQLNKEMLNLSSDTGQAVGKIGESTYQAISASVDTAKAVSTVGTATKAAIGGFTDTNTAIDGLTTVINSYGDKVKDATEVSDVFVTVQKLGKTSFGELSSSIGKVATNAANYNVSIQNLGTAYIELTKRGIQTSEATTYMNSLLKELSKSGTAVSGILQRKTGRSFAELMKEGKSLGEVIEILSESVGGNATEFSNLFSSQEAGLAAVSLMKTGTEQYNKTLKEVKNSAGATEEAYKKMADTSDYAKQKMLNSIENLKIAIGTELNKSLDDLYKKGGDVIQWATDFAQKNPEVVKTILVLSSGLAAVTVSLTVFTVATKVVIPLVQSFNAALASNPIGLVAVALSTLISVFITYKSVMSSANQETDREVLENQKARQAIEEKNKAIKENIETNKKELQSTKDSISNTENMISRLISLNSEERKSAGQKQEIKALVDSLKDKIPKLAEAYDKETGSVKLTRKEIKKLAEAYKEAAIAEAMQKQLKAAAEDAAAAETNLTKAKEQQKKVSKQLESAYKKEMEAKKNLAIEEKKAETDPDSNVEEHVRAIETLQKQQDKVRKLEQEQKKAQKTVAQNAETLKAANKAVDDAANYYDKYQKKVSESEEKQKKAQQQAKKLAKSYKEANEAFEESVKDAPKFNVKILDGTEKQWNDAVKTAKKLGVKIPANITKGLKDGSKAPETAVKELNKKISNELLAMADEARDSGVRILEPITKGISEGYVPVADGYKQIMDAIDRESVKTQKKMDKAGLKITKSMKSGYEKGGLEAAEAIRESKEKLHDLMDKAGVHSMEGLIKGVEEKAPAVKKAYEDMGKAVTKAYQDKLGIQSPSKVFAKLGGYSVDGIIVGTEKKKNELRKKYMELGSVTDVAFRNALEIHSPSKKFEKSGKYTIDGLVEGVNKNKKKAKEAAKKAADETAKAAQSALNKKQNQIVIKVQNTVSTKKLNEKEITELWKKAVKETKKGTDAHIKALKKYKQAKEKLLKEEKKLKEDFKKTYSDYMKDLKSKIKDYKEQITDLKNTYSETVSSTQSSIAGSWGMFGKAEITKTNNASGLIRNMKTQAETVEQYKKNMDKLRKSGLSEDLIKELESAGISSAGDVSTLATMTEQQLKEYQEYYDKRQEYAKKEALTENKDLKESTDKQVAALKKKMTSLEKKYKKKIDSLEEKYKKKMKNLGVNVSDGFAKGIEKGSESVYKAIAKMTGQTVKQVKKNLGIHSPSRVFQEMGGNTGLGFAIGLEQKTKNLSDILLRALPEKVNAPVVNNVDELQAMKRENVAPVQLNMYMDGTMVANATFRQIDLMQGANIKLINRGLAR